MDGSGINVDRDAVPANVAGHGDVALEGGGDGGSIVIVFHGSGTGRMRRRHLSVLLTTASWVLGHICAVCDQTNPPTSNVTSQAQQEAGIMLFLVDATKPFGCRSPA